MEIESKQEETYRTKLRPKTKKPELSEDKSVLLPPSKKIQKKRTKYQSIDDNMRLALFEAVKKRGEKLKTAANKLKINYSSAKSILFTFRKKGRITKKIERKGRQLKKSATKESDNIYIKEESDKSDNQEPPSTSTASNTACVTSVENKETTPQISQPQPQISNKQPANLPIYLNCFKKATSVLEKVRSISETLLLESLEEKVTIGIGLKACLNTSIANVIPSLQDLVCELQAIESWGINEKHPGQLNSYQDRRPLQVIPYHNPPFLTIQPFFMLKHPYSNREL